MKKLNFGIPKGQLNAVNNYSVLDKPSIINLRTYDLSNVRRILILNDIHIPVHDTKALNIALNYGVRKKVDCIILNGDITDIYALNDFGKIPNKIFLNQEIEIAEKIIGNIRNGFKKAKIIYKTGNHEDRINRFLHKKTPELYGLECLKLDYLLKLKQKRIIFLDNKEIIKIGKTNIAHGHELKGGGANPAKTFLNKFQQNLIFGHHHRSCEEFSVDLYNNKTEVFGVGCLSELSPDYLPNNFWNLGFGFLEILDTKGNYKFTNHRIINNKIY